MRDQNPLVFHLWTMFVTYYYLAGRFEWWALLVPLGVAFALNLIDELWRAKHDR